MTPDTDLCFHVIMDDDVPSSDMDRLREVVQHEGAELEVHSIDRRRLTNLPVSVTAHGGAISCVRLVLPDLLPEVERCLYIDADTLTKSSLAPLDQVDLSGVPVAAVRNVVEPAMRPRLAEFGVADPLRYLNSGVLLMNLDRMRRSGAVTQLLSYVDKHGDSLLWVDQDALNAVFDGQWVELHPRWNAQNSFWNWVAWAEETFGVEPLAQAKRAPAILHFEGPLLAKPWHFLSNHAYRQDYRDTLRATPWGDVRLEDDTVGTRLIAWLPWETRIAAYTRLLEWRRARGRTQASLPRKR